MIGVVLSGGQSTRMGKDKGLLKIRDKVWARIALEKFAPLAIDSFVSINESQQQAYLEHFKSKKLLVDASSLKIHGPLVGVLSTHLMHPGQDIMVLACDTPDLQPLVLEKLKEEFHALQPEAIAFKGTNIEPLCAVYSAHGLEKINVRYHAGTLTQHSMRFVLDILQTIYLPIPEEWRPFFNNFNQPGELL